MLWIALAAVLAAFAAPASAQLIPGGIIDRPLPDAVGRPVDSVTRNLPDLDGKVDGVLKSLREAIPRTLSALGGRRERTVEGGWLAVDREWIALIAPEQLPVLRLPGSTS